MSVFASVTMVAPYRIAAELGICLLGSPSGPLVLPSLSVTRLLPATLALTLALPAFAQKEEVFGDGKPPNYREETMDRRLLRSKFYKAISTPEVILENQGCVQLYSGLFLALSEVAPFLHKRDDNFLLDPILVNALNTQLSTPNFSATAFLVAMVRRVMIDKRMPDEWLTLATALQKKTKIIDLAKLKLINEQVSPIDSSLFTLPLLKHRYIVETKAATSAVTTDVEAGFRDTYLDRDVSWAGATLLEIGVNQPRGKKKKRYRDAEAEELVAILSWMPPDPRRDRVDLTATEPVVIPPVTIFVRLQSKQFADIEKFFRGQRVLVKGRFWEMTRNMLEYEVRDGLVFNDIDWTQGVLIGRPEDVATCPMAINELTGLAPKQVGGFGH